MGDFKELLFGIAVSATLCTFIVVLGLIVSGRV